MSSNEPSKPYKEEYSVTAGNDTDLGIPPSRKNSWMYIMGLFGFLAVTALILTWLYAEKPKKYEIMKKRTTPAVRSVYAVVFSPVDTTTTRAFVSDMRREVYTKDSSDINMVIGGTAIYKRFISAEEFCRVLDTALVTASYVDLLKQGQLLSQVTGILYKDTLSAKIYLYGSLGSNDFSNVSKRLSSAARVILQRHTVINKVELVSYLTPANAPATHQFLEYFRSQGITVTEPNKQQQ